MYGLLLGTCVAINKGLRYRQTRPEMSRRPDSHRHQRKAAYNAEAADTSEMLMVDMEPADTHEMATDSPPFSVVTSAPA